MKKQFFKIIAIVLCTMSIGLSLGSCGITEKIDELASWLEIDNLFSTSNDDSPFVDDKSSSSRDSEETSSSSFNTDDTEQSPPYVLDYSLDIVARYNYVKTYYETMHPNAQNRLEMYKVDTYAKEYLGDTYYSLYDVFYLQCEQN